MTEQRRALRRKTYVLGAFLAVALFLTAVVRISQGALDIPTPRVFHLLSPFLSETEKMIPEAIVIRSVRAPRFFAAAGTGGILALSGAVFQGLLANPLAEPYTLGVASGAALGGALGFFFGSFAVAPAAFLGALFSLALAGLFARRCGGTSGGALILAGIVVNAVLSSGVTFLKSIADESLGAIVLWLMGSFSGASPQGAFLVWLGAFVSFTLPWIYGRQLDAISLGGFFGKSLGVDVERLRFALLCCCSLGVAVSVCQFGIIGFVGLAAPHMVRSLVGPRHRPLLCLSFLAGATLLAIADGIAQFAGELPAGVITALAGGPFFCWILARRSYVGG